MEDRLLDDAAVPQMFDDDSLEQRRRDTRIPDALRVDDYDRATRADAEARRLPSLHATGAEQKAFALEKSRQQLVQRPSTRIWSAKRAHADQYVARIRVHAWQGSDLGHVPEGTAQ
jgi:hypothetical protein